MDPIPSYNNITRIRYEKKINWYVNFRGEQKNQKTKKTEKNNRKNRTVKKNQLKFWKNRPVWFRFYKPETEKTKSEKKPSQTGKNRVKIKLKPSQTGFKKIGLITFFIKTEPNRKWSTLVNLSKKYSYPSYKNNIWKYEEFL